MTTPYTSILLKDVISVMDQAYPPHLAEKWDAVGLICGDPDAQVSKIGFALDCTDAAADAAIAAGCQMLIVHHPLLMRGVTTVAADHPKGRIIHKLVTAGCALFAAHTNADSARPGVNDALAELLGVEPGRPLAPKPGPGVDVWATYVPGKFVEQVKQAVFDAGAGSLGNYEGCAFTLPGQGQFVPQQGAEPFLGQVGAVELVDEVKLEFVALAACRSKVLAALLAAHPYEQPAYTITEHQVQYPPEQALGIGRVGKLDTPMTLREFTQRVADRLPKTVWGVRAAGDPDQLIETVAVSSGAGDGFLDTVRQLGVDCFVTSDLRHHPVDEYLRAGGPAVIDTAHWASESPWLDQAAQLLQEKLQVETVNLQVRTDPWTVHAQ